MLRAWLGSTSLDAFREHHLQRAPLGLPSTIADPRALLSWELLGAVLGAEVPADVLVVASGKALPFPAPRSLDELRAYFRMGIGLCLRHTERCHAGLRAVADAFETELGSAHVQLFVTPGGTHGFGWHYDDEDVFIAHTEGSKDYYFRANTVSPDVAARRSEFARYREESSALHTTTLIAGDFLYIPARWWHMAICRETSLSVSVGVRPRIQPFS
jgi:50S ribosomal protein L16 3-hydroxylase